MDTNILLNCMHCNKEFDRSTTFPDRHFLNGDIFYRFVCSSCNPSFPENQLIRDPITWPIVIHLVLYHLMVSHPERKYFKMKEDICATIIENWSEIIPHKLRSSNWENTLSSALSTHQDTFLSGQPEMGQLGWWALRRLVPPASFHQPGQSKKRSAAEHKIYRKRQSALDSAILLPRESISLNQPLQASPSPFKTITPAQLEAFVSKITKIRQNSVQLTADEEWNLCQKLYTLMQTQKSPSSTIRRLFRKLYLRHFKLKMGMKQFDLDHCLLEYIKNTAESQPYQFPSVFSLKLNDLPFIDNPSLSFSNRYYNSKPLPKNEIPTEYIRRDWISCPPKLGILRFFSNELCPIDFMHLSHATLLPVNAFLCRFFWPGIDVGEFLSISQYSIVARYKKLIIGCAFLTVNPCYIPYLLVHPDWEGAGIGSFMLYYLIQMSQSHDITLHASASNNALMLYQKFGFKAEEFVVNFYDKYFHPLNNASRNAFFLRLKK